MIMRLAFLFALILSYGLWKWFDWQEKKLDEKYGGNKNEGHEDNPCGPIVSEQAVWGKR